MSLVADMVFKSVEAPKNVVVLILIAFLLMLVSVSASNARELKFSPPAIDYAKICKPELYLKVLEKKPSELSDNEKLKLARLLTEGAGAILQDLGRAKRILESLKQSGNRGIVQDAIIQLARLTLLDKGTPKEQQNALETLKKFLHQKPEALGMVLGGYYERRGDYLSAEQYFKQAAAAGHPNAYVRLSQLYRQGRVTPPSADAADKMLTLAQNKLLGLLAKGNCHSLYEIGHMLIAQTNSINDVGLGLQWFEAAAKGNNSNAMRRLGQIYYTGSLVERDVARAYSLWERSARLGNIAAMSGLGKHKLITSTSDAERSEAKKWLLNAAKHNHSGAMSMLAQYYLGQFGNKKPSYEEAAKWLQELADNDAADGEELFTLAELYETGHGTAQNEKRAFSYYERAAQSGFTDALVRIGDLYRAGAGVKQEPMRSYRFYRLAASEGNGNAMAALVENYRCGVGGVTINREKFIDKWKYRALREGVGDVVKSEVKALFKSDKKEDHVKATTMLNRSVREGDRSAMVLLAIAYRNGLGVEANTTIASQWLQQAIAGGDDLAEGYVAIGKAYKKETELGINSQEAQRYLKLAMELGSADGAYELGRLYEEGGASSVDLSKAEQAYRFAALRGKESAMRQLGQFLLENKKSAQAEGVEWLQKAANRGDISASLKLAKFYIPASPKEKAAMELARKWLQKARDQSICDPDDLEDYNKLVKRLIAVGGMVERSIKETETYLEGLVQKGDTDAMVKLAQLYLRTPPSDEAQQRYNRALTLLANAAKKGNAEAMLVLGNTYAAGLTLKQSMPDAKKWWQKAAEAGNETAKKLVGMK